MPKLAGDAPSRRRFLKTSGTMVAMIPLVNLVGCSEEPKPAAPAEPAARPEAAAAREAMPDRSATPAAPADAAPAQAAPPQAAPAQKMAKLEESDPQAQALGYKHDSGAVDAAAYARHQADQLCENCGLYQAGQGGEEGWGGCGIFPGKLVAAGGWCNAYVPAA
ncbi:MAG: high-potential iron-sulfur protein [Pseudomonadales bacterium]